MTSSARGWLWYTGGLALVALLAVAGYLTRPAPYEEVGVYFGSAANLCMEMNNAPPVCLPEAASREWRRPAVPSRIGYGRTWSAAPWCDGVFVAVYADGTPNPAPRCYSVDEVVEVEAGRKPPPP